jgi:hypothetical protein
MILHTSRYSAFTPAAGTVPVRVTIGAPRFPLKYDLEYVVRELAPDRAYFNRPRPEFEAAFRAQLDGRGSEAIGRRLAAIAAQEDAHTLVLLCFEDLTQPGLFCHRRIFADWWQEQTGQEVTDLHGTAPAFEQGTLL